jgi:carbonic anhydrase
MIKLQTQKLHQMNAYERLLSDNKIWAAQKIKSDPDFFNRLVNVQTPEFLWIGCSDSRVPPNEITQTKPGEIFIHRNIANLAIPGDGNMLAVLDYAVNHLKIKHVIVCGHYGCGGIKSAITHTNFKPVLNMWLRYIKDVYRMYRTELESISDEEQRLDRLVELNIKEQVINLAKTSIIQRAWKYEQRPAIHGWAYRLSDGIIKPVYEMYNDDSLDPIYKYDNL